ncbi:MAG: GNAT family N-acetyltransferase [Tepidibacillus sp.]
MAEPLFRLANEEDFPRICQLYQLPKEHPKCKQIERWLKSGSQIIHVAELNEQIVGCVAIRFPKQTEAWLSHKIIDSSVQNQGLGTKMAQYEEEYAKAKGTTFLRLATRIDNAPIHWVIGEKLHYYKLTRWLRLRRLIPKAVHLHSSFLNLNHAKSSQIHWFKNLTMIRPYIQNHIDYYSSDHLIPYMKNLNMYTSLQLNDPSILDFYQASAVSQNKKIKGVTIYHYSSTKKEIIIDQLYVDHQDDAYLLLYHLSQFAAKKKLLFSLLAAKPTYPIIPVIRFWTKSSRLLQTPDLFVFGKKLSS